MNLLRTIKGVIILLALALCFYHFLGSNNAAGKGKRGDAPYCQEECLRRHSEKMARLSQEYAKTQDWMTYQDEVEGEIGRYSACVADCRNVPPVK